MIEDDDSSRGRRKEKQSEPSTFLRMVSILSSQVEGDFELDVEKLLVHLGHQWITEGKTQEDKHDRYVNSTIYILDSIGPLIEKRREVNEKDKLVVLYDEINMQMETCDDVAISACLSQSGDMGTVMFEISTAASKRKDCKDDKAKLETMTHKLECLPELYDIAIKEARENGFRRLNCGARTHYRKTLGLWMSLRTEKENGKVSIRAIKPHSSDYDDGLRR
jgi:hypothetical protein